MILIIAAMSSEVENLVAHLNLKTTHPFMTYEGKYKDKDCLLVISGVGKSNASSALTYMITVNPQIKQIINLGIAGGYKVKIYETFVVGEATYHDVDLTVFNYEYGQIPKFPTIYYTEAQMLHQLAIFPQIRLYTGDVFSTKPVRNEPYIVDMEGASLYQVAHRFNYPLVSIKVVSDVLDTKDQILNYSKNEGELAEQLLVALNQVLEVL